MPGCDAGIWPRQMIPGQRPTMLRRFIEQNPLRAGSEESNLGAIPPIDTC